MSAPADPDAVSFVVDRAGILAEVGRYEDALALVVEALRGEPEDVRLLLTASSVCVGLHRPDEALRYAQETVAITPDLAVAHLMVSVAMLELGEVRGARVAIDRSLALDPENGTAHAHLAHVLLARRARAADKARAREASDRSLEISPDDLRILHDAAMVRYRLGKPDEARELVLRGLEVAPADGDLLVALARLAPAGTADGTVALEGVLAGDPMHAEAGLLLHHQVWRQIVALGAVAVRVGAFALIVLGAVMSDQGIGFAPACGIVLLTVLTVGTVRGLRGLARASRPYLARSFRAGGRPTRAGFALAVTGLVVVLVVVVALMVVRDAALVRYLVVLAAVGVLLAGAGTTVLTPAVYVVGRAQGLYPDTEAGVEQLEHARRHVRRAALARAVLVVSTAAVAVGLFPAAGRTDALGVALLGGAMFVLPSVAAWWAIDRMLRAGSAPVRDRRSRAVLVASAALVTLVAGAGLVQVPVVPNVHDQHGRYVTPPVIEDEPVPCVGSTGVYCGDGRLPFSDLPVDPAPIEVPTFDVPDIDLDFDPPPLPPLDPGAGDGSLPPTEPLPDRDVPVTAP